VSAARVIKAVDILEAGDLNSPACLPGMPPYQFRFDGLEEGFHCSIIHCLTVVCPSQTMRRIAIAFAAHGHLKALLRSSF
jgi:hypothetical protein